MQMIVVGIPDVFFLIIIIIIRATVVIIILPGEGFFDTLFIDSVVPPQHVACAKPLCCICSLLRSVLFGAKTQIFMWSKEY